MFFKQREMKCSSCDRKKKVFFAKEAFPIQVIDWSGLTFEKEYYFCSYVCLSNWLAKPLSFKEEQG